MSDKVEVYKEFYPNGGTTDTELAFYRGWDSAWKETPVVSYFPPPTSIKEHISACYAMARLKGWWDKPRPFSELIALLHSEVSEAFEAFREGAPFCSTYLTEGKPEGIPIELADVAIRLFDMCGYYNIDLEEAIRVKMAYNETREYRHGGKQA